MVHSQMVGCPVSNSSERWTAAIGELPCTDVRAAVVREFRCWLFVIGIYVEQLSASGKEEIYKTTPLFTLDLLNVRPIYLT